MPSPGGIEPFRRTVSEEETLRANRRDWDAYADEYQDTHGQFLGDVRFIGSPEGVDEAEVRAKAHAASASASIAWAAPPAQAQAAAAPRSVETRLGMVCARTGIFIR